MEKSKLREYPFCGNNDFIEPGHVKSLDVECMICRRCGACGPDSEPFDWNTRHIPDKSLTQEE